MSLEVDDTDPDRVAVGVGSGIVNGSGETAWRPPIYYTTDGGKTWTDVTPINSDKIASSWKGAGHSSGSVASLVFGEGDEMWMTDWTEVYYTPSVSGATDAARNWSTKIKNIEELVTFSMLSPVGGDNLFTAADTKSAFLIGDDEVDVYPSIQASSSDRGKFQQGDYSAGNPNFIVGAYSSQDSSEGGYVYISENGGETWSIASGVNGSTTIYPGDAAVSAADTNKLVIATLALGDGSKILYSTDKGTTWTEATGAPTGLFAGDMWHGSSPLESDKNKGNIFYALASDGFYRSEDYGATWECTSTVPKLQQNSDGAYVKKLLNVVTYENCPGDVWVSSAAGVWYSNDFGDNFVQIEGLTNGSISLGKGRTDGSYVLYFNGILEDNNKAIYYSEDKGESFVRITDYNKYSLAKEGKLGASRNTYGRVYIGTSGLGWKYLDAPLDDYKIIKSWDLHDITATGLGNIVNTGESFVGTKISNLDYFGDFKYSVDWYGYVRNEITATQINATENAAGGSGGCTHGAITLMSDGIRMHTDYTNPWHITFTAPETGLYNLAPTRALTVQNPTAATKFYITAAGENLEIGPGGETEINAENLLTAGTTATINLLDGCEVELKQGETIVISGVAGGNSWNTYFTLNFEIELLEVNHEHVYDNDCDKTCDVCGYERETEHSWDVGWTTDETNHWHSCSVCGAVNDTVAHTFDSISGTVCSSCGYIKNAIETWNMHDELKKGLSALVATGADYKGTAFSALDLGAFDFDAAYYKKVWEINANGFKGASIYGSSTNNEQHDMLALTGGAVKTHADYNNATYITFTAPKSGKYTIVPTADLTVSGTGTSFTVSANGTALAIGPNGETDLTATTAGLKPVEVTLAAGDTIVVANKGDSWNTYFTFDFNVALTKDLTPIATYNMADEI
jgi:hypothetical protein